MLGLGFEDIVRVWSFYFAKINAYPNINNTNIMSLIIVLILGRHILMCIMQ